MGHKYLIVKGCEGLGNRLFTLSSAYDYAKTTKRQLIIDWSDGMFHKKGFNAFNCLFKVREGYLEDISTNLDMLKGLNKKTCYPFVFEEQLEKSAYALLFYKWPIISKLPFYFPARFLFGPLKKLNGCWFRNNIAESNIFLDSLNTLKKTSFYKGQDLPLSLKEDVVVYLDFLPLKPNISFLRDSIEPVPEIKETINSFIKSNRAFKNVIGVHIRNTDKVSKKGNLEKLIRRLKDFGPDYKIFLATDDRSIEKKFSSIFPTRLLLRNKKLPTVKNMGIHHWASRNGKDDLSIEIGIDSVVDMWLLASSEYLFYQENSSFSRIASIIHPNNELQFNWEELERH